MYTNFVSFSSFLTLSIFSLSLPHYHSLLLSPYLSSSLFLSLSAFQLSKTLCVSVSTSFTYLYFPSYSFLPLILFVAHLLFQFFLIRLLPTSLTSLLSFLLLFVIFIICLHFLSSSFLLPSVLLIFLMSLCCTFLSLRQELLLLSLLSCLVLSFLFFSLLFSTSGENSSHYLSFLVFSCLFLSFLFSTFLYLRQELLLLSHEKDPPQRISILLVLRLLSIFSKVDIL